MGDAVFFQLLWRRPLLVDVVTSAASKGLINGLHITRIEDFQLLLVNTLFVQRVAEHGHGLKEMIDQYFLANQAVPMELSVRFATGDKEAVAFVDLGEMHDVAESTIFQVFKTGSYGRLG